jgi:hypothetical protein
MWPMNREKEKLGWRCLMVQRIIMVRRMQVNREMQVGCSTDRCCGADDGLSVPTSPFNREVVFSTMTLNDV